MADARVESPGTLLETPEIHFAEIHFAEIRFPQIRFPQIHVAKIHFVRQTRKIASVQ